MRAGQIPRSGRDFEPLPCSWPMLGFSTMEKLSFTSPDEVGTNRPHFNMRGPEFEPCVARPEGSKFRSGVARNRKIRNFQAQKNRFPRKTFKSIITFFRRQRPDAFLTDRGHRGFEFFAHRSCPATQGSTFRARSARRVREKVKCAKS